ncbi:MAG TPA: hypothetical protein VIH78_10260 [Terriglobales bacterium]
MRGGTLQLNGVRLQSRSLLGQHLSLLYDSFDAVVIASVIVALGMGHSANRYNKGGVFCGKCRKVTSESKTV